jgi:hypothetical protein
MMPRHFVCLNMFGIKLLGFFHLGFVFCASLLVAQDNQQINQVPPKNYALMIGVTTYDHSVMNGDRPLKFPEKDARALGELLQESGYEVEYLLGPQATREEILKKLEGLSKKGNAPGVCVVGLFGHGVEMRFQTAQGNEDIQGCFCPFDTGVRQVVNKDGQKEFEDGKPLMEPVPESLVKMSDVVGALAVAKAGSRMLVADCCREMPNRARGRNLGLGANFSTDRLPRQTVMLFGCRPGEQALERDDWQHGAFTKSLIEELRAMTRLSDPVTSGTLGDRVKRRVQQLTSNQQNPTPVSLDSIDLGLSHASVLPPLKTVSIYPKRQTLTAEEKENRRQKAIAELPELGSEVETAFIRGRVYGPNACKFVLSGDYEALNTYFRELDAVYSSETSTLYQTKFTELISFVNEKDDFRFYRHDTYALPTLTTQQRFRAMSIIADSEVYSWANSGIRPYLAITTPAERVELFQTLDRANFDNEFGDTTNIGIHLALAGRYDEIDFSGMKAGYSAFIVTIPSLLGDYGRAIEMADRLDESNRSTALLLICDALLDDGDSARAKLLFANHDEKSRCGFTAGAVPTAINSFTAHAPGAGFGIAAYIAGRLDDEVAYREILQSAKAESAKSGAPFDSALRLDFINGLVRDL